MKIKENIKWLLLLIVAVSGCSKKNEAYKELINGGEIYYPGVVSNSGYRAGNLRTMLIWNPSPDPKISRYKIYWNNKRDSMILNAVSHNPLDTVKVLIPSLAEGTYNFDVYSIDRDNHTSIDISINGVRVYGPKYLSGIFNRGYNADTPYIVNLVKGSVQLKFNAPDSINTKTVIRYTNNGGQTIAVNLRPDSNTVTLQDFKFGTSIVYQSSYIPMRSAIDTFLVADISTFPDIKRAGVVTGLFIKNPGNPFYRSDSGTGKWGLPKDWQYNNNVLNQNNGQGGGWSTDNGGCIHFEAKNYSDAPLVNGKVYQTFTLPAGSYALDVQTAGYGGNINANEIVAIGTGIPDIDNINGNSSVLAWFHGDQNSIGGTHTLSFTLTQQTTVTFGWAVSEDTYTYLQFKSVALRLLQ